MTYIKNLMQALLGKTPEPKTITETVEIKVPKIVIRKDPRGLIQRDLELMQRAADTKPYKIGDPIELVARRAGQQDMIDFVKTKLITLGV